MISARSRRISRGTFLAALAVGLAACSHSDPQPGSAPPRAAAAMPGVRAYVDPETGELGAPATDEESPATGAGAADQPLEIVPGRTSAGGVMVDLRGRFSYGLRASVADDGRINAHCGAPIGAVAD